MRKIYIIMAVALAAAMMSSCGGTKKPGSADKNSASSENQSGSLENKSTSLAKDLTILVSNDSELSRENETIELQFSTLQESNAELTAENVVVTDANGAQIPSQVYTEVDGSVKLLFQATVAAGESQTYTIAKGIREEYPMLAYSRHVSERKDDYAYENNKVAGRIYGPALDFPRTFGSDIWLKCTERLVIDDWFKKMDYHHNYGEGMDCYKVGGTLGGGALVPFVTGENIITGDNWASFQHICDGPVRTKATFTYDAFDVAGKKYSATREIVLDANSHFVKSVTAFYPQDHEADSLDLLLGAVAHDVLTYYEGENWIAFTEIASDTKQPEIDGNISVALVYDKAELADNSTKLLSEYDGHYAIITKEKTGKPITVWTGSGWSQGGIDSPKAWAVMTGDFAYAQANPLKVTVKK